MTAGTMSQFVIYAVLVGASSSALIEFFGELQRAAGALDVGPSCFYLQTFDPPKSCCNSFVKRQPFI